MNKSFYQLFILNLWHLTWPWFLFLAGMGAIAGGVMFWSPTGTMITVVVFLALALLCGHAYDRTKIQMYHARFQKKEMK